jgi:DNA-binding CsgD family transcriptional regulator
MALMKKNEILNEISEELLNLEKKAVKSETKSAIRQVAQKIRKSRDVEIWEEFDIRFKQVHNDFYNRLNQKFTDLTPSEQRLCAFLKMNLSTKDISELTGTSTRTVETARYRIRKKLGLASEDNLVGFLIKI